MNKEDKNFYRDPCTGESLRLESPQIDGHEIIDGHLSNSEGIKYPIREGVPVLIWPKELEVSDREMLETYDAIADDYEKFADIPFRTFKTDEAELREYITNKLDLQPAYQVLEVGGGDGRGAEHIARRLCNNGKLYFQEISYAFLKKAYKRLTAYNHLIEYSVANACYLPFADNMFDAAHHFGGMNTFSDIPRHLREMCRVVKPGGKIVLGDEGIAPWLRNTEFAKIMMNSNPLLRYEPPINVLPVTASQVKLEWVMMGAFYLIELTVSDSEPVADYHIPIPSARGGTHWTRYYGQLEGVSDEAKKLAYQAQKASGKSMHDWLDDIIYKEAQSK